MTTDTYNTQQNVPPCPNNHMVAAILSTICCCLPFGIVAIVKASQVNRFYLNGFYNEAYRSAAEAQKWVIISIILGILSAGIYGGITFLSKWVLRL